MPDWVNTVPVTTQGKVLLVRQFRIGIESTTLETPGGVVDAGEKDMTMAAVRELEEETGHTSRNILPLASLNPNPAIMTNTVHFFLALIRMTAVQGKKLVFFEIYEQAGGLSACYEVSDTLFFSLPSLTMTICTMQGFGGHTCETLKEKRETVLFPTASGHDSQV